MRSPYVRPNDGNGTAPDPGEAVTRESYEQCHFCHSRIVFSHDLNLPYLEVVESARCAGCGVTRNPKRYRLQ